MDISKKTRIAWKMFQVRILARRIPITIGWDITNRCNLKCSYCKQYEARDEEADPETTLRVAGEMVKAGVEVVTFSGGEPLTRSDIRAIADCLKAGGLFLSLNTNGTLIPAQREVVRRFDHVKISIDGPEDIHDAIRGKGVFKKALQGLELVQSLGIRATMGTVISSRNADRIDDVFRLAAELGVRVLFQPVTAVYSSNQHLSLPTPSKQSYERAFVRILEEKKRTNRVVNSVPALQYLRSYPHSERLRCWGGRGIGRICADGTMVPCVTMRDALRGGNIKHEGFQQAFEKIPKAACRACYCSSTLDFNLLLKPDPGVLGSFARRVR